MARAQVPEFNPLAYQPAAGPVQRYATPERPVQEVGPSKGQQVAEALGQFAPHLLSFAENKQNQQDAEAIARAKETRGKNVMTLAEASKAGLIKHEHNPWFMKAWKEMDGSAQADQYANDLLSAQADGKFVNSTSQEESAALFDTFRKNWTSKYGIPGQDADFIRGFATKANGLEHNVRSAQVQRVSANILAAATDAFGQNVSGFLNNASAQGWDHATVAQKINDASDLAIKVQGIKPQDVNAATLMAVETRAEDLGSIEEFDKILGAVKTGSGYLLGTIQAQKVRADLKAKIAGQMWTNDMHARQQREYEREDRKRVNMGAIGKIFQDNMEKGIATTIAMVAGPVAALRLDDPNDADRMIQSVMASQSWSDNFENQLTRQELSVEVMTGRELSTAPLVAALRTHEINLPTFNRLIGAQNERISRNQASADRSRKLAKEAQEDMFEGWDVEPFKDMEREVMNFFTQSTDANKYNNALPAWRAQAVSAYWDDVTDWYSKNKGKVTRQDILNHAAQAKLDATNNFSSLGGLKEKGGASGVRRAEQSAPGVKAGQTSLYPTLPEPVYKSAKEFNDLMSDYAANGSKSKLAIMAKQAGKTVDVFIDEQEIFLPNFK